MKALCIGISSLLFVFHLPLNAQNSPLPGTDLLISSSDLSFDLVKENDAFLDEQIEKAIEKRNRTPIDIEKARKDLVKLLGLDRDHRSTVSEKEGTTKVKWKAFGEVVHGYGTLLEPTTKAVANIIYLPDADDDPTIIPAKVHQLSDAGARVLIMPLIPRSLHLKYNMSQREWLHRPAFELGRTLIGYEIHKVISAADWLDEKDIPLVVIGKGEGGLISLLAGALDTRFHTVGVAGYFGPHDDQWKEPSDRNIFGLVTHYQNADLASLIHPRNLIITQDGSPDYRYRASKEGTLEINISERAKIPGKPARLLPISKEAAQSEFDQIPDTYRSNAILTDDLNQWFEKISSLLNLAETSPPEPKTIEWSNNQIKEIELHNQLALHQAYADRKTYWKNLDTKNFTETIEPYREKFRKDVIGEFEIDFLPFNARIRPLDSTPNTKSYEVVLDVCQGLSAYGILTIPANISPGEKLPVVVCQHGLEGSPQDVIGEQKYKAYKAFATTLVEEGFVTFSPQNGYKYFDLFRLQQFKAQSIGKTLFSIIIPQHQQITDWLGSLSFVDKEKIAFYGLSYGGKSAMRIPPLVENYCLSICSADFNDWVWKNAATDPLALRYTYANKGEYEIFEWNLGGTFNYAEMAYLIAPRPFMVERGHFDGVAPDHRVALEFAKVRNLYAAQLKIPENCEIEWFDGPHSINAQGTFEFLKKHLKSK